MNRVDCPQEAAVAKAVRTDHLDESLTTHAAGCAACREIIQASRWMQALAGGSEGGPEGGSEGGPLTAQASRLWWEARLSERQSKAENAQDLLECVELISVAVITFGLAGWALWNWFAIQGLMAWIFEDAQLWLAAYSMPAVFLPIVVILCLTAVVLGYPILADE
jgi:hypothetical protein